MAEFGESGSSFTVQLRSIQGNHACILWTAETAGNWYEFATDILVVQNGEYSSPILRC
jgi:hypothetical protein